MNAFARLLAAFVLIVCARGATAASQQLGVFGPLGTFLPGSPVRVHVAVPGYAGPVEASALRMTAEEAAAVMRGNAPDALIDDLRAKRRAIARARGVVSSSNASIVDLGRLPAGVYGVRLVGEKAVVLGVHLVDVTTLGVLTNVTSDGVAALAVNLRTMRARPDVAYRRDVADATQPVKGGADGLTMLPTPAVFSRDGDVVLARGGDGAVALLRSLMWYPGGDDTTAAVQLDRPMYRPGQRVLFRVILRNGHPGAYTIPAGTCVVRVRDPKGTEIATQRLAIDAYGTVHGAVDLSPDARLGDYYAVDVNDRAESWFAVEAYERPEYLLDVAVPPWTPGGVPVRVGVSARYVFGRPAAGMHLHYRARFNEYAPWWRGGGPFRFAGLAGRRYEQPPSIDGEAVTGGDGRATIAIPTGRVDDERGLIVAVDARDVSGRTVTASAHGLVTPGSFRIELRPRTYFNGPGRPVTIDVHAAAYGERDAPRSGVAVSVSSVRVWYDGDARHEDDASGTQTVTTDRDGNARVTLTPAQGGYYDVTARARDERGSDLSSHTSVWVSSATYDRPYAFTEATVVPQKPAYRPGERAVLLVTSPQANVDALVHVRSGSRDAAFVRRIGGTTATLDVDVPSDVPSFVVDVTVPTAHGPAFASASLDVVPRAHALHVAVRPDKATYAPGDRARFAVRVEDAAGKPAQAEVALAVVDDALFAVRARDSSDPYAAFYASGSAYRPGAASWASLDEPATFFAYPPMRGAVGSTTSRPAPLSLPMPSAAADVYSIDPGRSGRAPAFDALRSDFRETAYWTPSAVTGTDGTATVTFTWPDSLTSYTASGVAVTQATDIGSGSGSALVTKNFLVRVSAPRFLRHSDTARIGAIAQGTKAAKGALLRFSAPALGVADDTRSVRFDGNATGSTAWNVRGGTLGAATLRLAGTSEALRDGLRASLPVESELVTDHERDAGRLPSAAVTLRVPRDGDAGDLRIDVAPSVVAQLAAGVRLLEVYPYGCVEQTMSSALPAVFVDRLRKRAHVSDAAGPEAAVVAKHAVDRLVQLQHVDGSWGWWEHDAANPFMSAYALYGLTELSRSGYAVPATVLERGARSVAAQAAQRGDTLAFWGGPQADSEWNTRAFMLFALAGAAPQFVDRALLAETDAKAASLNSYALAVLGLAHVALADRTAAQPLLTELLRRVQDEGSYAHWEGGGWHYRWEDDPIETTAYAVRFVHAMTPSDPRIARAAEWLRAHQRGSWFETTKDSAAAIAALSETLEPGSDELSPHETVRVLLDGRPVKTIRIDEPVLAPSQATFVVPAALLHRGATVSFAREGTGTLYWSTDWTRYVAHPAPSRMDSGVDVRRTYTTSQGNVWRVGDTVDVEILVRAQSAMQFVAIEDPLPAGLEYQPQQGAAGYDWSGLQFFDDRVVFFADRLDAQHPLHLRYTLRATTPGSFTAPAPTAYAMYGPPLTALGETATVVIR